MFLKIGFSGCIRRLEINGQQQALDQPSLGLGLSQCQDTSPCNLNNACINGATCADDAVDAKGYRCNCAPGFSGKT